MPDLTQTISFCGLPFADLHAIPDNNVAAVFGAGHALGTARQGPQNGPYFLRTLSKKYTWSATAPAVLDLRERRPALTGVVDLGDLCFGGMRLPEALEATKAVVCSMPDQVAPCVIGGDHTVTLAVIQALTARRGEGILVAQFDNHLDVQTWGGHSAISGLAPDPVFNTNVMSHVAALLGPGSLLQIGVDPFATAEAGLAEAVTAHLAAIGRQVCIGSAELEDPAALLGIAGRGRDVYVTVDVDVLDAGSMSSTGYPASIGLTPRELLHLIDLVIRENRLIGFDVVEFAAPHDARDAKTLADGGRAVTVFLHLLSRLVDQRHGQRRR
jgi:arginase family enzyme